MNGIRATWLKSQAAAARPIIWCGWQNNGLVNVHVLIPGICEYVIYQKGTKVVDEIKVANHVVSK